MSARLRAQTPTTPRRSSLVKNRIAVLENAIRGLLEDYRTEGCPDPKCRVCVASKAAEAAARRALAELL